MKLPHVHAVTDAQVLARPDFLDRARRVATLGARVAIHLRDRTTSGRVLAEHAVALQATVAGTGAAIIVNARPDIAAAIAADGVQLGAGDLGITDARCVLSKGWIGRSVHAAGEARAAAHEGAEFLLAGTTYASASHTGFAAQGVAFITEIVSAGPPVIAIGGITPGRASEVHASGAYGVAAIRAIWDASDPADAVTRMLAPWEGK